MERETGAKESEMVLDERMLLEFRAHMRLFRKICRRNICTIQTICDELVNSLNVWNKIAGSYIVSVPETSRVCVNGKNQRQI